ncbi:MAG: sensor histidine kinase, partial [Burkholderiaceae bacterium]
MHVAVVDTGLGMDETTAPGTGLANLRPRLAAFYGAGARLELSEVAPHGVQAQIALDPAAADAVPAKASARYR